MRFLIDNAISPAVCQGLSLAGHDAVHVRDIGQADATDEVIFAIAKEQSRILISADTDFGTLLALREDRSPSVILFRGDVTRNPRQQLALLNENLATIVDDLDAGSVAVFDGRRIRVRRLPF